MPELVHLGRAIADLDELLQLLCQGVVNSTPWGRHLQARLARAGVQMQMVRMTISMQRGQAETAAAAKLVFETLRVANAMLAKGRTDATTHAAIKLATGLAQSIYKGVLEKASD